MADQPSYLGLLNDIVAAESRAHRYLEVWADATSDPVLEARLRTVALREGEHGRTFARRINELGFEVDPADEAAVAWRVEIAGSARPDHEKAEQLGVLSVSGTEKALRLFDNVFSDHSIDIRTGELLGRFIAEEHDTVRLLHDCYQVLRDRLAAHPPGPADDLGRLEAKLDALGRAVEDLRQVVCAQGAPVSAR
jgi:hypothetical protein